MWILAFYNIFIDTCVNIVLIYPHKHRQTLCIACPLSWINNYPQVVRVNQVNYSALRHNPRNRHLTRATTGWPCDFAPSAGTKSLGQQVVALERMRFHGLFPRARVVNLSLSEICIIWSIFLRPLVWVIWKEFLILMDLPVVLICSLIL